MGTVEFLSQAYHIDLRINSKLEQLESLNSLAVKATTTFGNEPVSGSRDVHRREAVICKIIDLQNEINDRGWTYHSGDAVHQLPEMGGDCGVHALRPPQRALYPRPGN